MSTTTITRPRSTKKYKALIAAGLSDSDALLTMGVSEAPVVTEVDNRVATLVSGGFTQEQAEQIVRDQDAGAKPAKKGKKGKKAKAAKVTAPAELTAKERAEALVAEKGLTFTRGRIYSPADRLAEAIVRVAKTNSPEIVTSSGVGHVAALLVYREDSGDVAVQNLKKPV